VRDEADAKPGGRQSCSIVSAGLDCGTGVVQAGDPVFVAQTPAQIALFVAPGRRRVCRRIVGLQGPGLVQQRQRLAGIPRHRHLSEWLRAQVEVRGEAT
jgi:hypothetical protein